MDIIEKVKGFLSEPTRAFETSKEEPLEEAVKYYLLIAAVYSLLFAIITGIIYSIIYSIVNPLISESTVLKGYIVLKVPNGITETFGDFFMLFILMLICVFLWGAILHVFAYILGGRWNISRSIKVALYSSTPLMLLGWIPFLGIFAWIWVGALNVVGLHQYQDLSEGKAITAVLAPIILLLLTVLTILIILISTIIPMAISGLE
ncbi:MAG: YIP1 family protein [Methanosarcinales archaeon]|nr:MAG: YIP1 family protein [Methanosarcinales archaeon]